MRNNARPEAVCRRIRTKGEDVSDMTFPVDPTATDISPTDLLLELPSRAALRRALAAAGIDAELDDETDLERFLTEFSQVERRQVAAQARYAAPQTIHYFRFPELPHVSASALEDLIDSDGFGGQVRAVEELHDRVYVVCSVPEGGTQAQLSVSEDDRVTTVATFEPQSQLLAVRARDTDLADGTVGALRDHPDLTNGSRVPFEDDGVRGRFEDAAVRAYERLSLGVTTPTARTERIDVVGTQDGDAGRADVRHDGVVTDLMSRGDTQRREAQARLDLRSSGAVPAIPTVRVDFQSSAISFSQWVPERTMMALDRIVSESL